MFSYLITYAIVAIIVFGLLAFDYWYYENRKPIYTVDEIIKKIEESKRELDSHKNDDFDTVELYLDILESWEQELRRTIKYNKKHGIKD